MRLTAPAFTGVLVAAAFASPTPKPEPAPQFNPTLLQVTCELYERGGSVPKNFLTQLGLSDISDLVPLCENR